MSNAPNTHDPRVEVAISIRNADINLWRTDSMPYYAALAAAAIEALQPARESGIGHDGPPPPIPFTPTNPSVCTCVDPFSNCRTHG